MSVNTEGLLESVRSLPSEQLQEFTVEVLRLNASRRSPALSAGETEALKEIHKPLPADVVARYRELVERRDAAALTADEHCEFCGLSDRLEERNAERLARVADLAKLRGVPLAQMMEQLGLGNLPLLAPI